MGVRRPTNQVTEPVCQEGVWQHTSTFAPLSAYSRLQTPILSSFTIVFLYVLRSMCPTMIIVNGLSLCGPRNNSLEKHHTNLESNLENYVCFRKLRKLAAKFMSQAEEYFESVFMFQIEVHSTCVPIWVRSLKL